MANPRMILAIAFSTMSPSAAVGQPVRSSPVQPAHRETWEHYWSRLAAAAMLNDRAGIAAASATIVRQHGSLDSDPVVRVPRVRVAAIVMRLVRDPQPIDRAGQSLRDALAASAPARDAAEPLGYRRVGPLVFGQIRGQWWLTEMYVED